MQDNFLRFHPIVNFLYFFLVIGFSMFFLHPVYMIITISAALSYSIMLLGIRGVKFSCVAMLPMLLVVACINPLFNHEGATILMYLKNGNPMTLESIIYGFVSGTMIITVILWFVCYNQIMTSDRFIFLFGKIIPSLSLIFSMVLRFVPLYRARIKVISNAQKCIGNDVSDGNLIQKAKNGIKILSIMTTWALENGIETSDSMRARGYGLKGRTAFSNFVMTTRDKIILAILLVLAGIVFGGSFFGLAKVQYFPNIKYTGFGLKNMVCYSAYFLLAYTPIVINIVEELKWKYFTSKV